MGLVVDNFAGGGGASTGIEGGPARDALVRTDDGRVAWSPEAAPVVAKVTAAPKKVAKKKAAKRR